MKKRDKHKLRIKRLTGTLPSTPCNPTVYATCPICESDFNVKKQGHVKLYAQTNDWWTKCILVCNSEYCQQEAAERNTEFVHDMIMAHVTARVLVLTPNKTNVRYDADEDCSYSQMGHQI